MTIFFEVFLIQQRHDAGLVRTVCAAVVDYSLGSADDMATTNYEILVADFFDDESLVIIFRTPDSTLR